MSKPGSQIEHQVIGTGIERYVFAFKDKPNRQGSVITDPLGRTLEIQEIRIAKVPGQNNRIQVEIVKAV